MLLDSTIPTADPDAFIRAAAAEAVSLDTSDVIIASDSAVTEMSPPTSSGVFSIQAVALTGVAVPMVVPINALIALNSVF